jgi:mannose-1-phosphate guanylyltransferase
MTEKDAMAILLPYKWTDVGTWGSVFDFFADGSENYLDGNVVTVNTGGSLLKTSNKGKLLAVAGVKDLVIVDTDDALLIVPRDKTEQIKELQAMLKERNETEYL